MTTEGGGGEGEEEGGEGGTTGGSTGRTGEGVGNENLLGWSSGEYFQSSRMFSKTALTCFDHELELTSIRKSIEFRISKRVRSLNGSNWGQRAAIQTMSWCRDASHEYV